MDDYKIWIKRAYNSLALAKVDKTEEICYEDLCYNAQQAVEKGLNKRVKLIIISSDDNDTKLEQRKQAFERIVKRREAQPTGHWTDEERDNARYEYLKEKHL